MRAEASAITTLLHRVGITPPRSQRMIGVRMRRMAVMMVIAVVVMMMVVVIMIVMVVMIVVVIGTVMVVMVAVRGLLVGVGAAALDLVVVALLRQAHHRLEPQDAGAIEAVLAVHRIAAGEDLVDPLGEGV